MRRIHLKDTIWNLNMMDRDFEGQLVETQEVSKELAMVRIMV